MGGVPAGVCAPDAAPPIAGECGDGMAKWFGLAVPEEERDADENWGRFLREACFGHVRSGHEEGRYLLVSVCCLTRGATLHDAAVVVVAAGTSQRQRQQLPLPMTRNERGRRVQDTLNLHRLHAVASNRKDVFELE